MRDLKERTKRFAIAIIGVAQQLPSGSIGWTIQNQIVRSSTSVAANYRAACRAKSDKDFISKLETVIEEADETLFWLELLSDLNLLADSLKELTKEADELVAIFVASVKKVKLRMK